MKSFTEHGDPKELYRSKLRTARQAADLVGTEDMVAAPIATGQPAAFLSALGERDDFSRLRIFSGILIEPYGVLQKKGVNLVSGFYGPLERMMAGMGANVDYLPADFLGWERYALQEKPRVVVSAVAPMGDRGFFSFGLHSGATFNAFLEAARDPKRLAIVEVVRDMPTVFGLATYGSHAVHVSEVDGIIESDRSVFVLPGSPSTEEDCTIAKYVEELIDDGSTLQFGIGSIPNIVAELLAAGRKGDFGVHTEMFVDGIMKIHLAGKVTNRKGLNDGFSISTFAAGSAELYRWLHRNPEVRMLPVAQVNDPGLIRQNRKMVSINSALAIDLSGQVMADTIGPLQYSGVGGHELFVMGAHGSDGGKSIICLHSTASSSGQRVPKILPVLPLGTKVTTPRHHVQYVVTEYGVAHIGPLTDRQRIEALIAVAHPDDRDALRAAAESK